VDATVFSFANGNANENENAYGPQNSGAMESRSLASVDSALSRIDRRNLAEKHTLGEFLGQSRCVRAYARAERGTGRTRGKEGGGMGKGRIDY